MHTINVHMPAASIARCRSRIVTIMLAGTSLLGCMDARQAPRGQAVELSKVPLEVTVPADWLRAHNADDWVVYRPKQEGILVAMAGEKSCSVVEKRLYNAMADLGHDAVDWEPMQADIQMNGLRATVARGRTRGEPPSAVKYVFAHAPESRGCLVAMYNVLDPDPERLALAESVVGSIRCSR